MASFPAMHPTQRRRLLGAAAATTALPVMAFAQDGKRLEGIWGGELAHKGEHTEVYFTLAPGNDGSLRAQFSLPVLHLYEVPLGKAVFDGTKLAFASLTFAYDAGADRLTGTLPADILPVYSLSTTLTRRSKIDRRERPDFDAPVRAPLWTVELGTPVWSDVAAAHGLVYVGGDDG